MVDQADDKTNQDKRKIPPNPVVEAVNEIAATPAGLIFFTWLMSRCFYDRSTIVGNPETYEVNTIGSMSQEFVRRLYLDIRRMIKLELRKKIENQ